MNRLQSLGRGGRLLLAVAVGGAVFGIATAVQASIPDASGVIHGCYSTSLAHGNPTGGLRVIDTVKANGVCASWEKPLNWNAAGVTGATGPIGPTGPTGPTGPSDAFYTTGFPGTPLSTSFETILSFSLPPGSYTFNASLEFAYNFVNAIVGCSVFLGSTQLSPGFADQIPQSANAKVTIPMTLAFTLATTTTVSTQCAASAALGAVPQPSTMTATRVGSLTTS